MIVLDQQAIAARIDFDVVAAAVEDAYRASSAGDMVLPPVGYIEFAEHAGDCHVKYGYQRGTEIFVVKVAAGFPGNDPAVAPANNGASLVLSAVTGEVLALLHDKMLMTDIRTGIGGAIASRTLARADAKNLLVVGTGVQAHQQIRAHRALLPRVSDIRVWGRSPEKASAVAAGEEGVQAAADLADACAWADLIVTVTATREPIIADGWITGGTHITAVGADAPGKHELDPQLLRRADRLVADKLDQCLDHGELSALSAEEAADAVELGSVLAADATARTTDAEITIADLTGIAAQDIAIARAVLDHHG